jgi:hypothetical protein
MTGAGSQFIKKVEQAPLFKPEEAMQWTYGTPNNSDFFQSRINPVLKNNEVMPFETERVGPGLNNGYTNLGTGGFNSGMEARDKWLPYTVDQLRVDTNPKLTYDLNNLQGPAQSNIKNLGILGTVEKQRPDTFFINTQDRWFTTTGAEKGETQRPKQELGIVRKNMDPYQYNGPAIGGQFAPTAPENYEQPKRVQLATQDVGCSTAPIKAPKPHLEGYKNHSTIRSSLPQSDTFRSGFNRAVGSVIAPIMDFLKPTRKDELIHSMRTGAGMSKNVPNNYVINSNDITPTTIKETTLYTPASYINNQKESLYVNNNTPFDLTQRDTTNTSYISTPGGQATQYGNSSYDYAYNQHNNDIKALTIDNRPNQGGMQLFNQTMNLTTIKSDVDRLDGRVNPAYSRLSGMPPSLNTYGAIKSPQTYNEGIQCDRMQPDILNAFKSNPYTHSLTSSV